MIDRSFVLSAALAVSCGALAACTSSTTDGAQLGASERAGRQCFRPDQVSGFNAIDNRTVYVTTGPRRMFRLELFGTCPDVNWSNRIGIRSRSGGWICSGLDAELIIPRSVASVGPRTCPVTNIRQLTDEEVQAFRSRSSRGTQGSSETAPSE